MAELTKEEILLARIRDVISRKKQQALDIRDLNMIEIYERSITEASTALAEMDVAGVNKESLDYLTQINKRNYGSRGLSKIEDDEKSIRERYDESQITIADVDQLLGDILRTTEETFARPLSDIEFLAIEDYLIANLFLPIDERTGPFDVSTDPDVPTPYDDRDILNTTVARAMVDGEVEVIKWPTAMTKDKKIALVLKQLQESGIITSWQRDHDANVLNNLENNWDRIMSDIDQYTTATASSFENGIDSILDIATAPTESEEKGQLAGWTQLGQEDMLPNFEEYTSAYESAGQAIEDIESWASTDALTRFDDYVKLHFPDAVLTEAEKAARNRIIAEGKIALQKNIDSFGPDASIDHIARVNQKTFNNYVFGDISVDRDGIQDQIDQAKFQEDFEEQVEDYSTFKTTFDSWTGIKGVVEEWLLRKGPIEVTDERKNQIIQRLISELPDLREFTADPQNRNTFINKLETLYGDSVFTWADEKAREEALEKFDTRPEVEAAVKHFLDQLDFNIDISAAAKNKIGQDVFDAYQAASLNPSLNVPDIDAILGKYAGNIQGWQNQKFNQELLESEDAVTNAIRKAFGMDTNMQIDSPEIYTALEGKGRPRLESMVRDAITADPFSSKSPLQYAAEIMGTRGITPSGDIGEYPSVWVGGEEIAYDPIEDRWGGLPDTPFSDAFGFPTAPEGAPIIGDDKFIELAQDSQLTGAGFDPPLTKEELDADYIRRLEEGGAPQPIIDYYERMLTKEYQEASITEQLQSARPPQIPQEFLEHARTYVPTYDFLGNLRDQLASGEIDQDRYDALVAQQVGDPSYPHLTDADFPTREGLLGGIRDEFSGSTAGREFIERQITEGNIDFSDIDARLGEINRAEGLRHPQTIPSDPMALIPSFTQQQLPTLAQDFAKEQQQEQVRRGELTGAGSTIFRRRTL